MNERKSDIAVFTRSIFNSLNVPKWQQQHLLEILEKPKRNTRLVKNGKRRGQLAGTNPSYVIIDAL